jgi:hypothetical protein
MDTVYVVLCRWGPEWDGQSLYRTKSKALFDYIDKGDWRWNTVPTFSDFPEELKADIRARYEAQKLEYPDLTSEVLDEEMDLGEAMEWLDSYGEDYLKFPVILAGTSELTCSWNW